MTRYSSSVNDKNFLLRVQQLEGKVDDLIFEERSIGDTSQEQTSRLKKLSEMFSTFADDSLLSAAAFKKGSEAAEDLQTDLLAAKKKLRKQFDAWTKKHGSYKQVSQRGVDFISRHGEREHKVTPESIVREFEDSVEAAISKHMPTIEKTYSIGDEVYAAVRPLLAAIVYGINAFSEVITGEKAIPEIEGEYTPSSDITNEFKGKYDSLSKELNPPDATEKTPLQTKK
jgi:hypothetical protein